METAFSALVDPFRSSSSCWWRGGIAEELAVLLAYKLAVLELLGLYVSTSIMCIQISIRYKIRVEY